MMAKIEVKASLLLVSLLLSSFWVGLAHAEPVVVAPPAPVVTNEDVDVVVDFSGVFVEDDPPATLDIYRVDEIAHGAIQSAVMAGTDLQVTLVPDAFGIGTVTVEVENSEGDTEQADVTITVNPVDDPPQVGAIPNLQTNEDESAPADTPAIDITGIFSDPEADIVSYSVIAVNNPALLSADATGGSLVWSVAPDQFDVGDIVIRATDSAGLMADAIVPFEVVSVNDDPTLITDLSENATEDQPLPLVVDVSTMFADVDIATGDVLTFTAAVQAGSTALFSSVSVLGSDVTIEFAAEQNGLGTIEVTARDSAGATVDGEIDVSIAAVNDPPVAVGSLSVSANEDENAPANTPAIDVTGLFDDVDIDTNGDTLSYTVLAVNNTAIQSASAAGGLLTWSLVPNAFESGDIIVRATDGGGATADVVVPFDVLAVNDPPTAVTDLSENATEDQVLPLVVDVSVMFDDIDIATGDTLAFNASPQTGATVFESVAVSGNDVTINFAENQNGFGVVEVTATDSGGESVDALINVSVAPVNDAPFVDGLIPNINMDEDDPPRNVTVAAFDDVDIDTNADVLTLSVASNDNPGIFGSISFVDDQMTITLAEHAFGDANISVIATDLAGASSSPVSFTVTVDSVDDTVAAEDDGLEAAGLTPPYPEDGGQLIFDVMANDDIPEGPGTIISVSDPGTFFFIDGNGDTQTPAVAEVIIDGTGSRILVTPAENYFGPISFTYTVRDADPVDPETGTATVSFVVEGVNDPPEAINLHEYTTFENSILVVPTEEGLTVGAFDVDSTRVDENGDPLLDENGDPILDELTVIFTTVPPLSEGVLSPASDGSFVFQPVVNFTGVSTFTYQIFDNEQLSEVGTVQISVLGLPDPADPPAPGQVATPFNLANVPLEQTASVPPNVLVSMDDSGSMDWNVSMDLSDLQGRFPVDNTSIATSNLRFRVYSYLWDLPTNTFGNNSNCCGRILPSPASLDPANDYEVWRGRSAAFNAIYYDPTVRYEPWTGVDPANNDFADADPENIRLDPTSTANLFDILAPHSYISTLVPNWDVNGVSADVAVNNFYIPVYYESNGTQVEIRVANEPFAGGPNRDDCANPTACTYDEEIQNFANWFQYHRSRGHVAKAAVGAVVADLQDIRVGYETINRNVHEEIADMNELYWEGEKEELLDAIYSVNNNGSTPLRRALHDAGRILGCDFGNSRDCPAASGPEGQCQQNYALLFSDGFWNQTASLTGNFDEDGNDEWDGGRYADAFSDTVADVAMFYYENDLFPAVDNAVPVGTADIDGAPADTFANGRDTLHQHVKTYTIAFGVEGNIDSDTAYNTPPEDTITWQDPNNSAEARIDDMLHAALNGRGRFLNAGNPQELQTAIETAFLEFTQAASSTSAAAFNSTSLRDGTLLYRGFYDLRNRTGQLTATEVDLNGVLAATPTWEAAELLDATNPEGILPDQRVITTFNPSTNDGTPFRYSNLIAQQRATLSNAQVDYLRGDRSLEVPTGSLRARLETEGLLGDIVNSSPRFVGRPRSAGRDQRPFPIPQDNGVLYSDFADSNYDRAPLVYVGANDGMLHAFDALTGKEEFAYVPNLVIDSTERFNNQLDNFTSTFYLHDYYVDLTPRLNDAWVYGSTGTRQWRTILVGGLGAGGKGFYALDITDPTSFSSETGAAGNVLWEFTESDDTYPLDPNGDPVGNGLYVDPNNQPVTDLGYSLSLPILAMSNKASGGFQDWVAIFGNGPNSTSGIATLFILDLDGGTNGWTSGDFIKLSTHTGVPLTGPLEGFPEWPW